MSTADDIRVKASVGREPIGGPYNEGNTSPVTVYRASGAVVWTSGMSIDCDGQPGSACNINTDPYFQAQTAFNQSNGQPLKAEELPFVVIPLKSARWDYTTAGIRGGDLCVMVYKDKFVFGVVGDLGPSKRIGEGSYAAAAALGINPNPRSGGVGSGVTYVVFPGTRVSPIESKAEAVRIGTAKLAEWLGTSAPPGEEPPVTTPLSQIDKMVAEAEKTLGWSDQGNTVRTPIHTWYNEKFGNPDPSKYAWDWCDGAVTYWAHKSGNAKAVCFSDNGHFAYTVAHADAFRARGQWHSDVAGIRRGDIVFFDWSGSNSVGAIDHVGLVTGVNADGTVATIEGNIDSVVGRFRRTAASIAGYGRPAYSTTSTPPTTPEVPPVALSVYFEETGANGTVAANKVVQTALNKWKTFSAPLLVDGVFGPKTSARYRSWQESLFGPGPDSDGKPGVTSLTRLGERSVYPFTVKRKTTTPPPVTPPTQPPATGTPRVEDYLTVPEAAHNYSRVSYGGKTVNVRTREMLKLAATWAGVTITLTQGSYNRGVSASAGTHDGGGVVDISVNAWSASTRSRVVLALRKAGFAAWLRTPAQGFSYHIHACAIGDREMAGGAKNQVQAYFNGRNGLANNGADDAERRWPNWADKYNL